MKKYRYIILFFLSIFLLSNINTALSKCPIAIYTIKGVVISNDNKPIQNAFITTFLDKEDQGFTSISSENGEFEIKYLYATDKVSLFGDACGRTPSSLTVVVHKNNFFSKRVSYKIKKLRKEEFEFYLPSISLIKIQSVTLDLIKSETTANGIGHTGRP